MQSQQHKNRVQKILNLSKAFIKAVDADDRQEITDTIGPIMERLSLGLFRVVVMGEIKKGKSSFINALLGETDLLPTDSDVATSTVYKLIYGPKRSYTVFIMSKEKEGHESPDVDLLKISEEQLWEYGTEKGNPDNEKGVDFIGVELPNPLLKQGLAIVDTPGVGGLFKKHRDITFRYAPNADAVFFIIDSVESVINEYEIKFLKELFEITKNVFFVQTKTDRVDTKQREAWKERNLDILSSELGLQKEKIPYFTVNSEIKGNADGNKAMSTCGDDSFLERMEDLEDSGFISVLNFVKNKLISEKNSFLVGQASSVLSSQISRIGSLYQDRYKITKEENKEKLQETEEQLKETQKQFEEWRIGSWHDNRKKFGRTMADLKAKITVHIDEKFDPLGVKFQEHLGVLRSHLKSPNQVYEEAEEILGDYVSFCVKNGQKILNNYHRTFCDELSKTINEGSSDLNNIVYRSFNVEESALSSERHKMLALDAIGRMIMYGGGSFSFTTTAAYIAGTILSISNPIGWGVLFGAAMLSVGTAAMSIEDSRKMKLKQAMSQLEMALKETSIRAKKNMLYALNDISRDLDNLAQDKFDEMTKKIQSDLKRRLKEVQLANQRSQKEAHEAEKKLRPQLQAITKIHAELKKTVGLGAAKGE